MSKGMDSRFVVEHALLEPGEDSHAVGRELAARAVARIGATLAYDGTRPLAVVISPPDASSSTTGVSPASALPHSISITHTRTQVFVVAARVAKLGVDLVDYDDARLERIAARFLAAEHDAIERHAERLLADGHDGIARALAGKEREAIARDDARQRARAMAFAAKEAGLKALGLGLLDGGVIDGDSPVRIVELDPPSYAPIVRIELDPPRDVPLPDPPLPEHLELALYDVGFSVLAIAHA